MLSLKAAHDSRRTRIAALPPSARLHYNLSRTPVAGTSISASARLNGAVILAGGMAAGGRTRPQRNTATMAVVGQGKARETEDSTQARRIGKDKQLEVTTAQAPTSNEGAQVATAATVGDVEPATADPPAQKSLETANPPPLKTLRRADLHDFEIVSLAPTLAETVLLPLPSPALDEDEWEILAPHDETSCS
ncbi:hypothetical protein RTBOTA2_005208 [Rhodotorula toruloides]|uniref:Uncharacterized protein n=1 Tax=Rhodotorula toruloides TaxID=5286 RepID=A0A2T0A898_RHOTO|nr:hypothetical protein RTBOTA2_005208 [Rhodotorula toruloides]PRQ74235.1 hypothetical protein AAT19DRAFT_14588 [Rhodotorula toruloides]